MLRAWSGSQNRLCKYFLGMDEEIDFDGLEIIEFIAVSPHHAHQGKYPRFVVVVVHTTVVV